MTKSKEEILTAMIRNVKELYDALHVGTNGYDRSLGHIHESYKVAVKIFQEQLKNNIEHKDIETKDVSDKCYDETKKQAINDGFTVVEDAAPYGLSRTIPYRMLEVLKRMCYKYYKSWPEYQDCVDFFESALCEDFEDTFERVFFNDFNVFSVRSARGILTAFKPCDGWEIILSIDGFVFRSHRIRRSR